MRKILKKIVSSMLCLIIILSNIPYINQTFASYDPLDNIDGINITYNGSNTFRIYDGVIDYPFRVEVEDWNNLYGRDEVNLIDASVTISSSEAVALLDVNDKLVSNNTYTYNIEKNDLEDINYNVNFNGELNSSAYIKTKTIKGGLATVYLNVSVTLGYNETQKTFSATKELQLNGETENNYPKITVKAKINNQYESLETITSDPDHYSGGYCYGTEIKLPSFDKYNEDNEAMYRFKGWTILPDENDGKIGKIYYIFDNEYVNGTKLDDGTINSNKYTVGNHDVYLVATFVSQYNHNINHWLKNPTTNLYDCWKETFASNERGEEFNPTTCSLAPTGYHVADYNTSMEVNKGDYKSYGQFDCSFDLYYDLNQYTVTLDANGGSVGTGSVTTTYSKGDYCDLSWNTPTKTGYIFDGWYTEASGGTKVYNADGSCANEGTYWSGSLWQYDGSPTFYAHWTPITYTIAYNGNGATEGSTTSTTHTYDSSTNLATNGFKRKYTVKFDGNGGSKPANQVSEYSFHRWRQYANNTGWEFNNARN